MNEELAVLEFFSDPDNLPLALSVAEKTDAIRQRLNNQFWQSIGARFEQLMPTWQCALTEDRNSPDCYVGMYLQPETAQKTFLRPVMEQQMTNGEIRIYIGLMWNAPPAADKTMLPEVRALTEQLQHDAYKNNESFLGWRWTPFYPRRKSFLLSQQQPEQLLAETSAPLSNLLSTHGAALDLANLSLRDSAESATVSLAQLRKNLRN